MTLANAVEVRNLSKTFRLYHEKNQYLKTALLRGRRARFDQFSALSDVSLSIPKGSTFGIIGANGSGKSTLLKCLAGILTPDRGEIVAHGKVAALLELGAGFHPDLTGRENVYLNGAILGMSRAELNKKFHEIVEFAGLSEFIDSPVRNYSSGMTVRLGFAIAINVDPDILIIDEVLAVGDAAFQLKCYEKIEDFRKKGKTIIIVSHGLSDVASLCDQVAWLDKGVVVQTGSSYDIVGDYVGNSHDAQVRTTGEVGDRWGSGEVLITGIEFLDSDRQPISSIRSGESVVLRVNYDVKTRTDGLVVGLRITHLHGTNIWGTNSKRRGVSLQPMLGSHHVDVYLPVFPLLAGTYDLTVALNDESEIHSYDHWEKGFRFDVVQGRHFDEGLVTVEAQFSIE